MISYIKGKVLEANPLEIVLDVNGIGYSINIPVTTAEKIGSVGDNCELFIHSVYREDSISLYGFHERHDRDFFKMIIEKVSGIGPKIAISIFSKISVKLLKSAIYNNDTSLLSKCPGIGKKTAERLIIELKDKIYNTSINNLDSINEENKSNTNNSKYQDAVASLLTLGYKLADADNRVNKAQKTLGNGSSVESIIKEALGS